MSSGFIPTKEQSERIGRAVTHYERTAALLPPLEQRRIVGGAGGSSPTRVLRICLSTNAFYDNFTGNIVFNFEYDGESSGNVTLAAPNHAGTDFATAIEGAVTTLTTGDVTGKGSLKYSAVDLYFPNISLLTSFVVSHTLVDGFGTQTRITAIPYLF